jgi:hypothetical protein
VWHSVALILRGLLASIITFRPSALVRLKVKLACWQSDLLKGESKAEMLLCKRLFGRLNLKEVLSITEAVLCMTKSKDHDICVGQVHAIKSPWINCAHY